jgi:two-component system, OmpR family, alkaline phosphatase synthesis response regulator PhoP
MTKRILIVDDENFIRLLLRRTLEDFEFEGVEIHVAEDGLTGLEAARSLRPDLLFLDLMMPGMDGLDVCTQIKADPELANVHVVILTAKGQLPSFPEGRSPNAALTKPFDPDQIVELAQSVLGINVDIG